MIEPRFITMNADEDDLNDLQYRKIFGIVSAGLTDRKFVEKYGGPPGHSAWSKYRRNRLPLTRQMKQILRGAHDLPLLPRTLCEVMEDDRLVDPNAACYAIREDEGGVAERILLVFGQGKIRVESRPEVGHRNALEPRLQRRERGYKSIALSMGVYSRAIAFKTRNELTWDGMLLLAMGEREEA